MRAQQLLSHFQDISVLWEADTTALRAAGLTPELAQQFVAFRRTVNFDQEFEKIARVGAKLITWEDDLYPAPLRKIPDYPLVLYVKGTLETYDELALTIIGTRKATQYGRDAAFRIARDIAKHKVTIVSGLAQGIDTAAHRGALAARGRTLAVLGCGIDRVYPPQNDALAKDIVASGALISEFAIGTPPHGYNFPRRNRLMSGLALGVLVAEAPLASGALLTADLALAQGREVFAIPANIFNPVGEGCNRLIQDGAKLITCADDILSELQVTYQHIETKQQVDKLLPMSSDEETLYALLNAEPQHIDDLVRASGLPTHAVSSALTLLELKGLAQSTGSMHYCRSRLN